MNETEEKMTALKKAYADIILNTAKEAAARIMVSERKASRYQQELSVAKEEALHMLLRLKQTMDSKVREAEIASSSQQKKIDELEAQLQEAEDIVSDLRAELTIVRDECKNIKSNQSQPLYDKTPNHYVAPFEKPQDKSLHASGAIMLPCNSQLKRVLTSDMKDSTLLQRIEEDSCCGKEEYHLEDHYVGTPDLPSIISRNKKPKLYRNGCTQRIHAFERNSMNGSFALSRQLDDKHEDTAREDEKGGGMCKSLNVKTDACHGIEKNLNDSKKVKLAGRSSNRVQAVKSFLTKRKRAARYRKAIAVITRRIPNQIVDLHQVSDLSSLRTSSYPVDYNAQYGENPCEVSQNGIHKDLKSHLSSTVPSNTTEMHTHSGRVKVSEDNVEFIEACTFQNTISGGDKTIIDEVLTRQESGTAESLSKIDLEIDNVASNSDGTKELLSHSINDRCIKYTFQRKRKKEPLGSADESTSLDNSPLKRKMEEKQHDPEQQKAGSIPESSRDSRRLAQVARQLISLSEKKW